MATWPRPVLGLCILVVAILAGCVGKAASDATAPKASAAQPDAPGALKIHGVVTDVELNPLPDVDVVATPGPLTGKTDANGTFALGPVTAGDYVVSAQGAGYKEREMKLTVEDGKENKVWITLTDPIGGQPYHETQIYVTYTFCTTSGAPCAPVNTVTSTNLTPDRPDLQWKIPGPGLANMKYEMTWPPSLFAGDKSFTTRNPGGLFLSCNSTANAATPTYIFFSGAGPSGFGIWIKPGAVNPGGCLPFDGTDGKQYYTVNRPEGTNATIPLGIVVDQKINNYLTFFYYLKGPPDFSAVPDH